MKLIILLTLAAFSQICFSAEADNFTTRTLNLTEVSGQVNSLANQYLEEAIHSVNENTNCDEGAVSEKVLYNELRKYFANHSKGKLVRHILYTEAVPKNALPVRESVYSKWSPTNGFLLGNKRLAASALALSPLIQIGDQSIGVDKLEHMFGMGFSYFKQYYTKKKSIEKILKTGILKEKTILGGNFLATGVFSYGDLSANFNGMRFWNHMLLKNDDILGKEHNVGPYITCVNSKWQAVKENPIDFKNYIDSSMDESINCSKFANDSGTAKFISAVSKLGYGCPVDPASLKEMQNKYKPLNIQHFILNEEGNGTVSYFNEF